MLYDTRNNREQIMNTCDNIFNGVYGDIAILKCAASFENYA